MTTVTDRPARQRGELLVSLGVNLAAPMGLCGGLTALGVGQWPVLVLGAVPPAAHAVWTIAKRRRVDGERFIDQSHV